MRYMQKEIQKRKDIRLRLDFITDCLQTKLSENCFIANVSLHLYGRIKNMTALKITIKE